MNHFWENWQTKVRFELCVKIIELIWTEIKTCSTKFSVEPNTKFNQNLFHSSKDEMSMDKQTLPPHYAFILCTLCNCYIIIIENNKILLFSVSFFAIFILWCTQLVELYFKWTANVICLRSAVHNSDVMLNIEINKVLTFTIVYSGPGRVTLDVQSLPKVCNKLASN